MSIPFTYLIGWSRLNVWYYGVRYANGCSPSDLWVKYFTSSPIVDEYRLHFGEPDVIEVRRSFTSKEAARKWEFIVIKRMCAVKSLNWLNRSNAAVEFAGVIAHTEKAKSKIREARKRQIMVPVSDETKAKIGAANRDNLLKYACMPTSNETKAKISAANKGNARIIAAVTGRKHSEDAKRRIGDAKRGRVTSDETRAKLSLAHAGKKRDPEVSARIAAARIGMKYKKRKN